MSNLPRLALGAIQSESDPTTMLWALLGLLHNHGRQPQVFHDQACFAARGGSQAICGVRPRYLDPWLMSPELCRESFVRGTSGCDVALVSGRYHGAESHSADTAAGGLETLCQWLDLPKLAVVDVSQVSRCRLPMPPAGAVGLLLDHVAPGDHYRWQTTFEALWGIPVLGALPEVPSLRRRVADVGSQVGPPCEVCHELARCLARTLPAGRLIELAGRRTWSSVAPKMFRPSDKLAGLTVALAYDEAFDEYFPGVLDLLELHGAKVIDFSPLHDEALPPEADAVYIGGGRPQCFAERLSANDCMSLALRNHARRNLRIYAEVGGLAYLSQSLVDAEGKCWPMSGVFPTIAQHRPDAGPPLRREITLAQDHWLGPAGAKLRGYWNRSWQFRHAARADSPADSEQREPQLLACHQAVGSPLHIHFAAQPNFLRRFRSASLVSIQTGLPD